MTELLAKLENFISQNPDIVTWSVAGFIILLALLMNRKWFKDVRAERKLNNALKKAGIESLHNVSIPDGMEGSIFIDNLILTPQGIYLVVVKRFRGVIFAAEKIDLWTQVVGNKSYKFDNPLRQLEEDIPLINALCKYSKVEPRVLFIPGSEFPKGKPDHIISIDELKKWREEKTTEAATSLLEDWKRLKSLAQKSEVLEDTGMVLDEDKSSTRVFSLLMMGILLASWLGWRLVK